MHKLLSCFKNKNMIDNNHFDRYPGVEVEGHDTRWGRNWHLLSESGVGVVRCDPRFMVEFAVMLDLSINSLFSV
jgi:hypothetical protein